MQRESNRKKKLRRTGVKPKEPSNTAYNPQQTNKFSMAKHSTHMPTSNWSILECL